jgi:transposase
MAYFAGLDVSVKETSVCIVDDAGKIVREARVASEPEALLQVLTNSIDRFKRIGLEAGPLSQWLYSVLAEAGLPVICVETRDMRAALKAQINKTDRHQTNIVSKRGELASDVMRSRTRFHADQAARNVGEPALKLSARAFELPNDRPALIETDKMEAILNRDRCRSC